MRTITFAPKYLSDDDLADLDAYQIPDLPLLTAEQEATATPDQLVEHNMRLSIRIACQFAGRGVPMADLVQEGNVGLIKAAHGYKPERGTKFSSYASESIFRHVQRAVQDHGNTIRIPVYVHEQRAGSRPQIAHAAQRARRVESLDKTVRNAMHRGAVENRTVADAIAGTDDTEQEALDNIERGEIRTALDQLGPKERQAVELHITRGHTFAESGPMMDRTPQRVHQIVVSAKRKLRKALASEVSLEN